MREGWGRLYALRFWSWSALCMSEQVLKGWGGTPRTRGGGPARGDFRFNAAHIVTLADSSVS